MNRSKDLIRFYTTMARLEETVGGVRTLADCSGRMSWPRRGVYFFFENDEFRSDTGAGPRIVRVGTHALNEGSTTKLWTRLRQHRGGNKFGGGNHRGSIFRLIVGTAIVSKDPRHAISSWDVGNTADRVVRDSEYALECKVSEVIRAMPFLWIGIEDDPGAQSLRGYVERNSIALLSNYKKPALDPPSKSWLGFYCNRDRVRASGLWNNRHVDESYDPAFIDKFEALLDNSGTE